MKYYKKIDVDYLDEIVAISLEYIKSKQDIYSKSKKGSFHLLDTYKLLNLCPQINHAFNKYNLVCDYTAAFITYSNSEAPIHIDSYGKEARINIPLENCKGSFTKFYSGGDFKSWANPETRITAFEYIGGATFADQVELDQPTVIRVRVPHRVQMNPMFGVPRVALTLGFNVDPVFLLDTD